MRWQMDRDTLYALSGRIAVAAALGAAILLTGCGPDEPETASEPSPRTRAAFAASAGGAPTTVTPVASTSKEPAARREVRPGLDGPVTFDVAETAYHERRYGDAFRLFTRYITDKPDNPWGHYLRGLSARKVGQLALADSSLRRALELDPTHVKSLLNLGRVLLDDGRPGEALDVLDEALTLDSTGGEVWRLIGRASGELDDVPAAMDAYQRALVLDDTDVWSMNNLGVLAIRQDRPLDALPPLARAAVLRPDIAVFQNNLGVALERAGYPGQAAAAFTAALEADSTHVKARVSLARVTDHVPETDGDVDLTRLADEFAGRISRWRAPDTPPSPGA